MWGTSVAYILQVKQWLTAVHGGNFKKYLCYLLSVGEEEKWSDVFIWLISFFFENICFGTLSFILWADSKQIIINNSLWRITLWWMECLSREYPRTWRCVWMMKSWTLMRSAPSVCRCWRMGKMSGTALSLFWKIKKCSCKKNKGIILKNSINWNSMHLNVG